MGAVNAFDPSRRKIYQNIYLYLINPSAKDPHILVQFVINNTMTFSRLRIAKSTRRSCANRSDRCASDRGWSRSFCLCCLPWRVKRGSVSPLQASVSDRRGGGV